MENNVSKVDLSATHEQIHPIHDAMTKLFNQRQFDPVHVLIALESMRDHLFKDLITRGVIVPEEMPKGLHLVKNDG